MESFLASEFEDGVTCVIRANEGGELLTKASNGKRRTATQSRSKESRRKILAVGRRHFAARGFEATALREIAEEAGVTHTLIRYHFGNKEELWRDVVSAMHAELADALSKERLGIADMSPRDGMRVWLRHYITYCARNPEHARISIQESLNTGERQKWMADHVKQSHSQMIPLFRHLMKEGELPDMWIISLFYSISAMCQLPFVLSNSVASIYGVDMTSDAAIEAHTDSVLSMVFRDEPGDSSKWPGIAVPFASSP